jgi:hypothetical protein
MGLILMAGSGTVAQREKHIAQATKTRTQPNKTEHMAKGGPSLCAFFFFSF